jgi:hypothetical protein
VDVESKSQSGRIRLSQAAANEHESVLKVTHEASLEGEPPGGTLSSLYPSNADTL